jgi:hypothetical protein
MARDDATNKRASGKRLMSHIWRYALDFIPPALQAMHLPHLFWLHDDPYIAGANGLQQYPLRQERQ